ncbi:MAG: hypothetical protein LUI07_10490 [Lachnospiraceae bacterium]|nr:hypothetical protein [Lachnospiraceae bacterium]
MIKSTKKKSLLFVLFLLLVLVTSYVQADDIKVISVNSSVKWQPTERGYITYQFKVSSTGKMNVILKHKNLYSTDTYWTVELLADDMDTVLQTYDSTGTDTTYTGASFGVTKGTYYVRVYARKSCSHKFSDTPVTLNVKFVESSNWEVEYNASKKEGNNKQGTATPLTLNKYKYGTIYSKSDVDYYTFKAKSDGYVTITFKHKNIYEADAYWTVQLVNSKTGVVYETTSAGTKKSLTTTTIGVSKGTYFVRISCAGNNYSSVDYSVRVKYTKSSSWEQEYTSSTNKYNNSMSSANKLTVNKTMSGTLSTESDVDYMRFTIKSAGSVNIILSHKYIANAHTYYKISLYNSRTKLVTSFVSKGVDVAVSKSIKLSSGTYFVRIEKGAKWNSSPYKITVKK